MILEVDGVDPVLIEENVRKLPRLLWRDSRLIMDGPPHQMLLLRRFVVDF